MTWIVAICIGLGLVTFDIWLCRKFPCSCGRGRVWYFAFSHERAGIMLGHAIYNTFFTILFLVLLDWIVAPIFALLAAWTWRRWWFHEKDKMKKKASKLAGAVGFSEHGKLVVKQVEP